MSEGFIALHRKILDSPVSNNPNYLAVWVFILCKVNFKDKTKIEGGKNVLYKRGEYKGSIAKIAEHFSLSRSTIKQIVDYFESEKMLYTQRTRNYTIFQVVNYDDYQGSEHKKPSRRQRTATTKNDNNDNNEDKNKQKGSRLPNDWIATDDYINFALSEGYTIDTANREAEKFKDYWIASTAKTAVKKDWLATWRNWIRNNKDKNYARTNKTKSATENFIEGFSGRNIEDFGNI